MEESNYDMTTLSEVMNDLAQKGITTEFVMDDKGFTDGKQYYFAENLTIMKFYRFEGESDADDTSVLMLIQTKDGKLGYTIDAYGYESNNGPAFADFIKQVAVDENAYS